MDLSTAKVYIEYLIAERDRLLERIRQLEAERDQWQTKAVSND